MANLGNGVKTAFLKGLEALGKTASNLSDVAQHKLNEMNLENRRRAALLEIPKCVMQLWKDGVELPEQLAALMAELTDVEQQLAAMRAEREAKNAKPAPEAKEEEAVEEEIVEEEATEEVEEGTEEAAEEATEEAVEAAEEVVEEAAEEEPVEEQVVCECPSEPCCAEAEEPVAEEIENA